MKELPIDADVQYGEVSLESFTELPKDAVIDYSIPDANNEVDDLPAQQPMQAPMEQPVAQGVESPSYLDTALSRLGEFPSNVASSLSKRNLELGETQADFEAGEINLGEWALQTIGKGLFGSVADIAGETAATILSAMTPDEAEAQIKEWAAAGANNILNTESAQELLRFYGELDPNTRKNLESAANIAAVYAPKGVSRTGKAIKRSGVASKVNRQKEKLAETFLDNSKKAKEARAGNPMAKVREDAVLNTLLDTKGVKPGGRMSKNLNAIDTELARLDTKLIKEVGGIGDIKISGSVLKKNIPLAVAKKLGNDPVFNDPSLKRISKTIENLLFDEKGGYIPNKSLSVAEVATARRNLDKGLKKLRGGQGDSSKMFIESGANGDIIRAYRDTLNEVVDGLAKNAGVDTSFIRSRQSNLLSARGNLVTAIAGDKSKNLVDKVTSYAMSHPFTVGAAASAATGTGGGLFSNPALLGLGAAGLGGIGAYKAATSPLTRIATGGMLQSQIPTAAAAAALYGSTPEEDDEQVQELLNR